MTTITISVITIAYLLLPLVDVAQADNIINLGQQKGFFEGDIKRIPKTRNGILKAKRWKNGVVPYSIDMTGYTQKHFDMIEEAIRSIEEHTCVRFVKHQGEEINLVIHNNYGCNSDYVGVLGRTQNVSLNAEGCFTPRIVMHELLHALGLGHEQSRYDRDQYLNVRYDRLNKSDEYTMYQLRIIAANESSFYGIPYNYASVMHYDAWAMGNGSEFIMEPRDLSMLPIMGFAKVNETDFEKIRRIYECPGNYPVVPPDNSPCVDEWTDCEDKEVEKCDTDYWTIQKCRMTCGYCEWGRKLPVTPKPFCEDRRTDCEAFIPQCNTKDGEWLKRDCPYTCGNCDRTKTRTPTTPAATQPTRTTPAVCQDTIGHCHELVNACSDKYMDIWCPKTCGYCGAIAEWTQAPSACQDRATADECKSWINLCGQEGTKWWCPKTCNTC